jgi:hypothetical protein
MSRLLSLHLDEDASRNDLYQALTSTGNHDVTRTPTDWMPFQASDATQLKGAIEQKRCIFTFNIRDFNALHIHNSSHCGIILAAQRKWTRSELITTLSHVLSFIEAEEMIGQLRWLNDWKGKT